MKYAAPLLLTAIATIVTLTAETAWGITPTVRKCRRSPYMHQTWHGGYYYTPWAKPAALVVPPTAEFQTHYGWGVGNYRVTPICPQFGPNWPGPAGYFGGGFRPTPLHPSDTDQFGVNYVRGPW